MNHTSSDKYAKAWARLFECVARGQKERALGLYRLLFPTITDKEYARVIEADIIEFLSKKS